MTIGELREELEDWPEASDSQETWSSRVGTGVRGYNLPAVVKLLEIHHGVPNHLLVRTGEIDGPPS
jgi:hypothetical protein